MRKERRWTQFLFWIAASLVSLVFGEFLFSGDWWMSLLPGGLLVAVALAINQITREKNKIFMGSGPVKGFAVVFILGILTTVITAVTMTRMMIALWYRWTRAKTLPF